MTSARLRWHSYRYFPYELELAQHEVQAVLGVLPRETRDGLSVQLNGHSIQQARRLTYVRAGSTDDGRTFVTDQARLEDSATRNAGLLPEVGPRRQSTRYSAHGLHEYRGKFNPQVVRAIGNIIGLRDGSWVLDPFCGSGTTLLEAAHCGWNSVGLDLNPLGVLISNSKIQAVTIPIEIIETEVDLTTRELSDRFKHVDYSVPWTEIIRTSAAGRDWESHLPNYEYLSRWFPTDVLAQFSAALQVIECRHATADVQRVVLSDLVRAASHQNPADLRIRRRKNTLVNYPLIESFLDGLRVKIDAVVKARAASAASGIHRALVSDSREPIWPACAHAGLSCRFDGAITSPPYVTALPYADTQRLSLSLLGLIDASKVMALDRALVGTRELTRFAKEDAEQAIQSDTTLHPKALNLCVDMLRSVEASSTDGFRRRNVPALVYRYFSDMRNVLRQVSQVVKPGGRFALVVGRNATMLGGRRFVIDTPDLIEATGTIVGWIPDIRLELETYQRFDVHHRNSIHQESLVVLRRSADAC